MFKELAQTILKHGATVAFTISKETEETLRVCIIPQTNCKEQETHESLKQPLLVIDTPENLDHYLPQQLADYTEERQETINTLVEATKALKETKTVTAKKTAAALEKKALEKQAAVKTDPKNQQTLPLAPETGNTKEEA